MNRYVLDSYAILVLMHAEPGHQRIRKAMEEARAGNVELHMSLINLIEVQYRIIRQGRNVQERLAAVQSLPVTIAPADAVAPTVVMLKARYPVALGDCFAAALAIELECPVVTGDQEFKKLEEIVSVEWLDRN